MGVKTVFLWAFAIMLFGSWVHAVPTTPQPNSLKSFSSDGLVDLSTGGFSLPQTLLTVPGRGGLDFPITISYKSGIPVDEKSSSVGLGWNLGLGSISRIVNGLPDDYSAGENDNYFRQYYFKCSELSWKDKMARVLSVLNVKLFWLVSAGINLYHDAQDGEINNGLHGINLMPARPNEYLDGTPSYCDETVTNDKIALRGKTYGFLHRNGDAQTGYDGYDKNTPDYYFVNGQGFDGRISVTGGSGAASNRFAFLNSKGFTSFNGPDGIPLEATTVKASYDDQGRIDSFTITSPSGLVYVYGQKVIMPYSSTLGYVSMSRSEKDGDSSQFMESRLLASYTTSWLLTEIRSFDYSDSDGTSGLSDGDKGNWVKLSYSTQIAQFRMREPFDGSWGPVHDEWKSKSDTLSQVINPTSVETPTHIAYFDFDSNRYDGYDYAQAHQVSRLAKVRLYRKNDLNAMVSGVKLVTNYGDTNHQLVVGAPDVTPSLSWAGRQALMSLEEYGADWNTPLQKTYFEYAQGSSAASDGQNPYYNSNRQDRWGYYCTGCTADDDNSGATYGKIPYPMAWSLSKVTLPTGGWMNLWYESNRYTHVNSYWGDKVQDDSNVFDREDTHFGGGIRVERLQVCDGLGACYTTKYGYSVNGFDDSESNGYVLPSTNLNGGGESSGVATLEPPSRNPAVFDRLFYGSGYVIPRVLYSSVTVIGGYNPNSPKNAPVGYSVHEMTTTLDHPNTGPYYPRASFTCNGYPVGIGPNPVFRPTLVQGPPSTAVEAFTPGGQSRGVQCTTDSDGYCQVNWKYNGNDLAEADYYLKFGNCATHLDVTLLSTNNPYNKCVDFNADGTCDLLEISAGSRYGGAIDNSPLQGLESKTLTYDAQGNLISVQSQTYDYSTLATWTPIEDKFNYAIPFLKVKLLSTVSEVSGVKSSTDYVYGASMAYPTQTIKENGLSNQLTTDLKYYIDLSNGLESAFRDTHRFDSLYQTNDTNSTGIKVSSRTLPSSFSGVTRVKDARALKTLSGYQEIVQSIEDFDDFGNPLQSKDPLNRYDYVYYGNDQECGNTGNNHKHSLITCSQNALGQQTKYSYNSKGLLSSVTSLDGLVTTYAYDSFGRLSTITPPTFGSPTITFDYYIAGTSLASNNLNWIKTRTKISSSPEVWMETRQYFDGLGREVKTEVENGATDLLTEKTYDAYGRLDKLFVPRWSNVAQGSARYSYSAYFATPSGGVEFTYPFGKTPTWYQTATANYGTRNSNGNTDFTVPSDGYYGVSCSISSADSGDSGLLELIDTSSASSGFGNVREFACSFGQNRPEVTSASAKVFLLSGRTYRISISQTGLTASMTVSNRYDPNNFVGAESVHFGSDKTYGYAIASNGKISRTTLDSLGQALESKDALGGVVTQDPNELGQSTKTTDARGQVSYASFDLLSRPSCATHPDAGSTCLSYDDAGNVLSRNRNSVTTSYDFDELNRQRRINYPSGQTVNNEYSVYDYPISNEFIGKLYGIGGPATVTLYGYNSRGLIFSKRIFFQGSCAAEGFAYGCPDVTGDGIVGASDYSEVSSTINYITTHGGVTYLSPYYHPMLDFDHDGDVEISEANAFMTAYQNGLTISSQKLYTLLFEYDDAGHVTGITYPKGKKVTYTYNALGQLTGISHQQAGTLATYGYLAEGLPDFVDFGNGLQTDYQYWDSNLLKYQSTKKGGSTYFEEGYEYDLADNLYRLSRGQPQGPVNQRLGEYAYDDLNRLTTALSYNNYYPTGHQFFSYDLLGNRQTYQDNLGSKTYTYDSTLKNKLLGDGTCSNYQYDSNGNTVSRSCAGVTTTFTYDLENRLTKVNYGGGKCELYSYDSDGNRVKKVERVIDPGMDPATFGTYYVYNGNKVVQELSRVPLDDVTC